MFSVAQEFVDTQIRRRLLEPHVESYDASSLEIKTGLLGGEASVNNLLLKKKRWVLGQIVVELDYGRLESVNLSFPWLSTKAFSTSVSRNQGFRVDGVFYIRPRTTGDEVVSTSDTSANGHATMDANGVDGSDSKSKEASAVIERLLHGMKLEYIREQELSVLSGMSAAGTATSSLLAVLLSRALEWLGPFELELNHVRMSLVMHPAVLGDGDAIHLRILSNCLALGAERPSTGNWAVHSEMRGFSVALEPLSTLASHSANALLSARMVSNVMNPSYIKADLDISVPDRRAVLNVEMDSLELTPTAQQLVCLLHIINQYTRVHTLSTTKDQGTREGMVLSTARPHSRPYGAARVRNWWRYAISTVIKRRRFLKARKPFSRPSTVRLPSYLRIYRRVVEHYLAHDAPPDDCSELDNMHYLLSVDDILIYRCMVHKRLQPTDSSLRESYRVAIVQLHRELLRRKGLESPTDEGMPRFHVTFHLSVTRLALALTYMKDKNADIRGGISYSVVQVCFYSLGLSAKFTRTAAMSAGLRIGSILGFGYLAAQIFSVGQNSLDWHSVKWSISQNSDQADNENAGSDEGAPIEYECSPFEADAALVVDVICSAPRCHKRDLTPLEVYAGEVGCSMCVTGALGTTRIDMGDAMVSALKRVHALLVAPAFDRFLSRWTHGLYHHLDASSRRLRTLRMLAAARSIHRASSDDTEDYSSLSMKFTFGEMTLELSTPQRQKAPSHFRTSGLWGRNKNIGSPTSAPTTVANTPMSAFPPLSGSRQHYHQESTSPALSGLAAATDTETNTPQVSPQPQGYMASPDVDSNESTLVQDRIRVVIERMEVVRGAKYNPDRVDTSPGRLAALGSRPLKDAFAGINDIIDVSFVQNSQNSLLGFRLSVDNVAMDIAAEPPRTGVSQWKPLLMEPVSIHGVWIRMGSAFISPFVGVSADIFVSPVRIQLDPGRLSSGLLVHEYLSTISDLEPFAGLSEGWTSNAVNRVSRLATLSHQNFNCHIDEVHVEYQPTGDLSELTMRYLVGDMLEHITSHSLLGGEKHVCFEKLKAQSRTRLLDMGIPSDIVSALLHAVCRPGVHIDVDELINQTVTESQQHEEGASWVDKLHHPLGISLKMSCLLLSHRHLTYDARWSVNIETLTLTDPYAFKTMHIRPKLGREGKCHSISVMGNRPLRERQAPPAPSRRAGANKDAAPLDMAALASVAKAGLQPNGTGDAPLPLPPMDATRQRPSGPGHRRQESLDKLLRDLTAEEDAKPDNALTIIWTQEDTASVWAAGNCNASGLYLSSSNPSPLNTAPSKENVNVNAGEAIAVLSEVGIASLIAESVMMQELFLKRTQWFVRRMAAKSRYAVHACELTGSGRHNKPYDGVGHTQVLHWQMDVNDVEIGLVAGSEPIASIHGLEISAAKAQMSDDEFPTYTVQISDIQIKNDSKTSTVHEVAFSKNTGVSGPILTMSGKAKSRPVHTTRTLAATDEIVQGPSVVWMLTGTLQGARATMLKCFWMDMYDYLLEQLYPSVSKALQGDWSFGLQLNMPQLSTKRSVNRESQINRSVSDGNNHQPSLSPPPLSNRPGRPFSLTTGYVSPESTSPFAASFLHMPQSSGGDPPDDPFGSSRDTHRPLPGSSKSAAETAVHELLASTVLDLSVGSACLLFPRNSASVDVVALTIASSKVSYRRVDQSWPSPYECVHAASSAHLTDGPLRFDPELGFWIGQALSNYGSTAGAPGYASSTDELMKQVPGAQSMGSDIGRITISCMSMDLFVARFPEPLTAHDDKHGSVRSQAYESSTHTPSFSPFKIGENTTEEPDMMEDILDHKSDYLGHVAHGEQVLPSREGTWKQLTSVGPVDKLVILDFNAQTSRLMISDTVKNAPIRICDLVMEDMHLIQSVWYDNFHEHTKPEEDEDRHRLGENDHPHGSVPAYGSTGFSEFLARYNEGVEILMIFQSIYINCLRDAESLEMQTHYFNGASAPTPPPPGGRSRSVPVSFDLYLKRGSFASVRGKDVHKVALGLADIELRDSRSPKCVEFPVIFRPQQQHYQTLALGNADYGHADFSFGLKSLTSHQSHAPGMSLVFTAYKCFLNQWTTTNVGVNRPDIHVDQWKVLHQICDYFMVYYRHEHYGNPNITSHETSLDNHAFFGTDYRIFLFYPLVTVMKDPMNVQSPTLMLESENGIFCRFIADSLGSRCLQVDAEELAVVVFKNFSRLRPGRGLRHDPGSGRGIRTLCEYLTFHFSLNYDSQESLVDVTLNMQPDDEEVNRRQKERAAREQQNHAQQHHNSYHDHHQARQRSAFTSFDKLGPEMYQLVLPRRHCLQPVMCDTRKFNRRTCDIVTSIDDLLFVSETLSRFLGEQTIESILGNFVAESDTHSTYTEMGHTAADNHTHVFGVPTHRARNQFPETPKRPVLLPRVNSAASSPSGQSSRLEVSIFFLARMADVKVIIVDDVLGLHRPFMQTYLSELEIGAISAPDPAGVSKLAKLLSSGGQVTAGHSVQTHGTKQSQSGSAVNHEIDASQLWYTVDIEQMGSANAEAAASSPKVVMLYVRSRMWSDAFNSILRCWEPTLEHGVVEILHEQSPLRGQGLVFLTDRATHFNLSSTTLLALHELLMIYDERITKKEEVEGFQSMGAPPLRAGKGKDDTRGMLDQRRTTRGPSSVYSPLVNIRPGHSQSVQYSRRVGAGEDERLGAVEEQLGEPIVQHRIPLELGPNERAGFSIENRTGQTLRYLQSWEGSSRRELHYLEDRGKAILNFSASEKLIRNGVVVEEVYRVHAGTQDDNSISHGNVTHELSLQISGYKWLKGIQSNTFGSQLLSLPLLSKEEEHVLDNFHRLVRVSDCLQLVAEVMPENGGRLVRLRSQFSITNKSSHELKIYCRETGDRRQENDRPFTVDVGQAFHIPIALLKDSIVTSEVTREPSLGFISIRPSSLQPIRDEFDRAEHTNAQHVHPSSVPIDLLSWVKRIRALNTMYTEDTSARYDRSHLENTSFEMRCRISRKASKKKGPASLLDEDYGDGISATSGRLPDFNYCVEVIATEQSEDHDVEVNKETEKEVMTAGKLVRRTMQEAHKKLFSRASFMRVEVTNIIHYNFVVHSPILLENLLPVEGVFQLVHATMNRPLYSGKIGAGMVKAIHTVNSSLPVVLKIWLSYAGSKEGVRLAPLSEGPDEIVESTMELRDSENQVLYLNVDTTMGNAGQRHVVVYCPYWIVNLTQFPLKLRSIKDSTGVLPAGSVTTTTDGSKTMNERWWANIEKRQYPGMPGPMAGLEEKPRQGDTSSAVNLIMDHSIETNARHAFLFSFDPAASNASQREVVVQLDSDSEWSTPVNLESIGIYQKLAVMYSPAEPNDRMGILEVGLSIAPAPGRLSRYTKIARFTPAYIITNKTAYNLAFIQQRFSWRQDDHNVRNLQAHTQVPYHLPEVNGEHTFKLKRTETDADEGRGDTELWQPSPEMELDFAGKQTVIMKQQVDLSALNHVRVRNQEVVVNVNPSPTRDEFGVWFENSDYDNILVRAVKKYSYAYSKNIQTGDQLIKINGRDVEKSDFEEAMRLLRAAVNGDQPAKLVFRTAEEIRRRIRDDARSSSNRSVARLRGASAPTRRSVYVKHKEDPEREVTVALQVDIEYIESAVLLSISDVPIDERPIYRVDNDLQGMVVYYKQKGIANTRWAMLEPGESAAYIWDEPLKENLIRVRVGENRISPDIARSKEIRSNKEEATISFVTLGIKTSLMYMDDGVEKRVQITVTSDGPTRVLQITAEHKDNAAEEQAEVNYAKQFVADQIKLIDSAIANMQPNHDGSIPTLVDTNGIMDKLLIDITSSQIRNLPYREGANQGRSGGGEQNLASKLTSLVSYFPTNGVYGTAVTRPNQIHLQIFEARQLSERSSGEMPDVYCVVQLRNIDHIVSRFSFERNKSATAHESLNPQWENQIFIIDIPNDAVPNDAIKSVASAKQYEVRILVKYKSRMIDSTIAETTIPLSLLIERSKGIGGTQGDDNKSRWVHGWLYLKSLANDVSTAGLNDAGSMKVSCCWVHDSDAYADYVLENLTRRRKELEELNITLKATNKLIAAQRNGQENSGEDNAARKSARKIKMGVKSSVGASAGKNLGAGTFTRGDLTGRRHTMVRTNQKRTNREALGDSMSLLSRKPWVLDACFEFFSRFDQECGRHFFTSRMSEGEVVIYALQARNIPFMENTAIGLRLFHRDHKDNEHRVSTGVPNLTERTIVWPQGHQTGLKFEMNLLNTSGYIRLSLMQYAKVFSDSSVNELMRLDLPVYGIIDAVGTLPPGHTYERWFPLLTPTSFECFTGELSTYGGTLAMSEQPTSAPFDSGNIPCIQLQLAWQNGKDVPYNRAGRVQTSKVPRAYSRIMIPNVSASIVESSIKEYRNPQEIIEITANDLQLRRTITGYHHDGGHVATWVSVGHLQMDNQLPGSVSPTMLAPTVVAYPKPIIQYYSYLDLSYTHEHLSSFDNVRLMVQAIDLIVEQNTVNVLSSFVDKCLADLQELHRSPHRIKASPSLSLSEEESSSSSSSSASSDVSDLHTLLDFYLDRFFVSGTDDDTVAGTRASSDRIYIRDFYIPPMMLKFSLIGSKTRASPRNPTYRNAVEYINTRRDIPLILELLNFLDRFGTRVSEHNATILGSVFKINQLKELHRFLSRREIELLIREKYINIILNDLYRQTGIGDLLNEGIKGSVGLVSSLGTGMYEFFYEPVNAVMTSPVDNFGKTLSMGLGKGLYKGTMSLLTNTAEGFIMPVSIITRRAGQAMAQLMSDDADFIQARAKNNAHPNSRRQVVLRPFKDVLNGFFFGLVGLVKEPVVTYSRTGTIKGFAAGFTRGLGGVAGKPLLGVLDAATHVGESVSESIRKFRVDRIISTRRRLNVLWGPDGRLLPWNEDNGLGATIMHVQQMVLLGQLTRREAISRFGMSVIMLDGRSDGSSKGFNWLVDTIGQQAGGFRNRRDNSTSQHFISDDDDDGGDIEMGRLGVHQHRRSSAGHESINAASQELLREAGMADALSLGHYVVMAHRFSEGSNGLDLNDMSQFRLKEEDNVLTDGDGFIMVIVALVNTIVVRCRRILDAKKRKKRYYQVQVLFDENNADMRIDFKMSNHKLTLHGSMVDFGESHGEHQGGSSEWTSAHSYCHVIPRGVVEIERMEEVYHCLLAMKGMLTADLPSLARDTRWNATQRALVIGPWKFTVTEKDKVNGTRAMARAGKTDEGDKTDENFSFMNSNWEDPREGDMNDARRLGRWENSETAPPRWLRRAREAAVSQHQLDYRKEPLRSKLRRRTTEEAQFGDSPPNTFVTQSLPRRSYSEATSDRSEFVPRTYSFARETEEAGEVEMGSRSRSVTEIPFSNKNKAVAPPPPSARRRSPGPDAVADRHALFVIQPPDTPSSLVSAASSDAVTLDDMTDVDTSTPGDGDGLVLVHDKVAEQKEKTEAKQEDKHNDNVNEKGGGGGDGEGEGEGEGEVEVSIRRAPNAMRRKQRAMLLAQQFARRSRSPTTKAATEGVPNPPNLPVSPAPLRSRNDSTSSMESCIGGIEDGKVVCAPTPAPRPGGRREGADGTGEENAYFELPSKIMEILRQTEEPKRTERTDNGESIPSQREKST